MTWFLREFMAGENEHFKHWKLLLEFYRDDRYLNKDQNRMVPGVKSS